MHHVDVGTGRTRRKKALIDTAALSHQRVWKRREVTSEHNRKQKPVTHCRDDSRLSFCARRRTDWMKHLFLKSLKSLKIENCGVNRVTLKQRIKISFLLEEALHAGVTGSTVPPLRKHNTTVK